jgi:hypothetical protein
MLMGIFILLPSIILFGGAFVRTICTEHTTVSVFRMKRFFAVFTGITYQTNFRRQLFSFGVFAFRTGNFRKKRSIKTLLRRIFMNQRVLWIFGVRQGFI